jgi:endoglucanase
LIDRFTGELAPANTGNLTTNYSYDAMRIPFRIALDYIWNSDSRALETLSMMEFFEKEWAQNETLYADYSHDGSVYSTYEAPGFYGGIIGYFDLVDSQLAESVYEKKLKVLYSPDENGWRRSLSYYDDNWAWFGLALYNRMLPNLSPVVEFVYESR